MWDHLIKSLSVVALESQKKKEVLKEIFEEIVSVKMPTLVKDTNLKIQENE